MPTVGLSATAQDYLSELAGFRPRLCCSFGSLVCVVVLPALTPNPEPVPGRMTELDFLPGIESPDFALPDFFMMTSRMGYGRCTKP